MDFSRLGSTIQKTLPTHPIKVFESLPSLKDTPNDLWRGQAEALENWHKCRDKNDVLVSLNTGAGKTIVGLLIAQSLVNEGHENVVYVCSTIDLVKQTSQEASRIGLPHTTRVRGDFNNNLFEVGKGFCITTYHALFNGHSNLRKHHFPGAIIFDDAHVAEGILRDTFTIRIDSAEKAELFNQIAELFGSHFDDLGIPGRFEDSRSKEHHATAFVAPRGLQRNKDQLLQLLKNYNIQGDKNLSYSFEHLKDHLEACAAVFTRGVFEISPPFLPALAMDVFERPVKRVYLSATLQSQTEFIRAFGRKPQEVIVPSNDAGNGERLIISGQSIQNGFSVNFVKHLSSSKKVVIAVPNYLAAEKWTKLAFPPKPDSFSNDLDNFRESQNGAFVLVSRVDGIDLPHETCRLMVMEGLPSGSSLLERYQWEFLRMENMHASRIANRIAQLFGRINRGRNDYGVFLLEGKELNIWLGKDRNISLLPPLLQQQVLLGRNAQEGLGIKTHDSVVDAIDSVLSRDKTWLDYYEREVKLGELDQAQVDRAKQAEPVLEEIAISEAKYAAHLWNKEYAEARIEIEESSNKIASVDTPLAGWHSVWLAAAYDLEGDTESAERYYSIAKNRIGGAITLPRKNLNTTNSQQLGQNNNFYTSLENYLEFSTKEMNRIKISLNGISTDSSNQAEEAVRLLGEILGFDATRPDNDKGTGPDVLWVNNPTEEVLAFELKTNKSIPTRYKKDDIGQGHNHIAWVNENYQNCNLMGLLFIGPEVGVVEDKASPSENMHFTDIEKIKALMGEVTSLLSDLLRLIPLERNAEMQSKSQEDKWKITALLKRLQTVS